MCQYLLLLLSALPLTATAEIYLEAPNNPSHDLKTWERQFAQRNANKLWLKLRETDTPTKSILTAPQTLAIINPTTKYKAPWATFQTGGNIARARGYIQMHLIDDYTVRSDVDFIHKSFQLQFRYSNVNTYYQRTQSRPNYFGVAFSKSFK